LPSLVGPFSDHIDQAAIDQGAIKRRCSCSHFQLSNTSPSSRKISPLWFTSPGWSEEWGVVKLEERNNGDSSGIHSLLLLGSCLTMTLLSAHLKTSPVTDHGVQASLIVWSALGLIYLLVQFKIFFPGERLFGPLQLPFGLAAERSVWALYSRCYMLYTSCFSVHRDESISEYNKGQFALQAWLESERIEKMLHTHTCGIDRANRKFSPFCLLQYSLVYFGRQILFE
jgi:hypothetical protein